MNIEGMKTMERGGFLDNLIEEFGSKRVYENEKLIFDVTEMIEILMEDKKINKSKLAQLLSVSISNVSQMLNGTKNMTLRTVSDILFHLDERMLVSHEQLYLESEIFDYVAAPLEKESYSVCPNTFNTPKLTGDSKHKQAA